MLKKNLILAGALMVIASMGHAQSCGGKGQYSCSSSQHQQAQHESSYKNSAGYRATYDYNRREAASNSARHGERSSGDVSNCCNPAVNNSGRSSGKGSASRQ